MSKFLQILFNKKPDDISVNIDRSDALLVVRLCVNGRRKARILCVIESETTILIGDIQHDNLDNDFNKGYGSMMMDKLLQYSHENRFTHIYGNLSEVDRNHKGRLHHFYEKFGFTITEYPELQGNNYGRIDMRL